LVGIGERIRSLRKTLNLTQEEFAARLKISKGFISNLEKGRGQPSEQLIHLMSYEFSSSEYWLNTGEGEMFLSLEEIIKSQMIRCGEQALINAFSKVLEEQDLVVPINVLGTRGDREQDRDLSDMVDFLNDLWAVADQEEKIWAKIQFARAFPQDIKDEVEKKRAALNQQNVNSS